MIVVDVPIGIPDVGPRQADLLARAFVGPRASSVFATPNRAALAEPDRASADATSRSVGGQGVSAQAFAIRDRILEVNDYLPRAGALLLEGHPEVSFRAHGRGRGRRRPARARQGVGGGAHAPRGPARGGGHRDPREAYDALDTAALDDVYDAAAMAWTARRFARGEAASLPDPPEVFGDEVASAILY